MTQLPSQVIINGSQSMHAVSEAGVSVRSTDNKGLLQLKHCLAICVM
jgi:hypothetical protein